MARLRHRGPRHISPKGVRVGTVNLIAKVAFPYAGQSLKVGDLFTASDKDAALLKLIGRAEDAPRLRKQIARKDLTAESTEPASADTPKRQYRRRDLVAEGSEG